MAKKKNKPSRGPSIIQQSIPQKSQDDVTQKVIQAYSKKPVRNQKEQAQKDKTLKKLRQSVTHTTKSKTGSPVVKKSNAGKVTVAPAPSKQKQQPRVDAVPSNQLTFQQASSAPQRSKSNILGSQTAPISNQLRNQLSFGKYSSSQQGIEQAANSAVKDIRNDTSVFSRSIFDSAQRGDKTALDTIKQQSARNIMDAYKNNTGYLSNSAFQHSQQARERRQQDFEQSQRDAALAAAYERQNGKTWEDTSALGKRVYRDWAAFSEGLYERSADIMQTTAIYPRALGGDDNPYVKWVDKYWGDNSETAEAFRNQYEYARSKGNVITKGGMTLTKFVGNNIDGIAFCLLGAGLGGVGGIGSAGAMALGGSAGTMALGGSAGATAITRSMVSSPTFWTTVMATAGPAYNDAREKGNNELESVSYALATSALQGAIEIGGGIEKLDINASKAVDSLKDVFKGALKTAGEEGLEEVKQDMIDQSLQWATVDRDKQIYSTTDNDALINPVRAAQNFAAGAALGGLTAGVLGSVNYAANHIAANTQQSAQNTQNQTQQAAQEMQNQTQQSADTGKQAAKQHKSLAKSYVEEQLNKADTGRERTPAASSMREDNQSASNGYTSQRGGIAAKTQQVAQEMQNQTQQSTKVNAETSEQAAFRARQDALDAEMDRTTLGDLLPNRYAQQTNSQQQAKTVTSQTTKEAAPPFAVETNTTQEPTVTSWRSSDAEHVLQSRAEQRSQELLNLAEDVRSSSHEESAARYASNQETENEIVDSLRDYAEYVKDEHSGAAVAQRYEYLYSLPDAAQDERFYSKAIAAGAKLSKAAENLKKHMSEGDIAIAEAAAERGDLSYIYGENNSRVPSDINSVVQLYDKLTGVQKIRDILRDADANETAERLRKTSRVDEDTAEGAQASDSWDADRRDAALHKSLQDFESRISGKKTTAGTILEDLTPDETSEWTHELTELRNRSLDADGIMSRAERFADWRIAYDPDNPHETPKRLTEVANFQYEMQETKRKLARKLSLDEIELANRCAANGLDYLWSSYNQLTPKDMRAFLQYYESVRAEKRGTAPLRSYIAQKKNSEAHVAMKLSEGIERGRDKVGWRFNLGTPLRNLQYLGKDLGDDWVNNLYTEYFADLTAQEAKRTRYVKQLLDSLNTVRLNDREAQYTQMLMDDNPSMQYLVDEFYTKYARKIDVDKCNKKAEIYRAVFKTMHQDANDALVRNGYGGLGYIEKYTPHFEQKFTKTQTFLRRLGLWHSKTVRLSETGDMASLDNQTLPDGTKVELSNPFELPNSIAGKTETFRPGRKWAANTLTRTGVHTDYNIDVAFANYVEPMADVIFYTDGIQKLRTLEDCVRYSNADVEVQEQFQEIWNSDADALTKRQRIESLFDDAAGLGDNANQLSRKIIPDNNLSGFITWLRRYTDNIAGKKSVDDRAMEYYFGRASYTATSKIISRISANTVTSVSASMTNFVPLAGLTGEVGPVNYTKALLATAKNAIHSDGFTEMSDFLTNREGAGKLNPTMLDKAQDAIQIVDRFTSQVVTRAYYYDALSKGLDADMSMDQANRRAGELMADRAKTQLPLTFQSGNPVAKMLGQFQVEVNNDMQHVFKDLPNRAKEEGVLRVAAGLVISSIAYAMYNDGFEKYFGYRPYGLDFVGWIKQFFDLDKDDDDEKDSVGQNIKELAKNAAESVPLVGSILGGGRVPVTSMLPRNSLTGALESLKLVAEDAWDGYSPWSDAKGKDKERAQEELARELIMQWSRPFATLATPAFGSQLRKTGVGLWVMNQGGLYGFNKKGQKTLLAAVNDKDPREWVQAVLAGNAALPEIRDYYKNWNSLTEEQTETYDKLRSGEIQGIDAYSFSQLAKAYNELDNDRDRNGDEIKGTRYYKMRQAIDALTAEDGIWNGDDMSDNELIRRKMLLDELLIGQTDRGKEGNDNDPASYEGRRVAPYGVPESQRDSALYAASTFSTSDWKKASAALRGWTDADGKQHAGLDWNTIVSVMDAIRGVDKITGENPYEKTEFFQKHNVSYYYSEAQAKALEIMQMGDLSAEDKKHAADTLVSNASDKWVFSSEQDLLASMVLSDYSMWSTLDESKVSKEKFLEAAVNMNFDYHAFKQANHDLGEAYDDQTSYKRYALYGMDGLTASEKKEIGRVLFKDADSMRYDDKNTITASMVSAACGNKWAMASHFGFTIDQFTAAWKATRLANGDKKADKVAAIVANTDLSEAKANVFMKIMYTKAAEAAKYNINPDTGEASYSGSGSGSLSSGGSKRRYRRRYRRSRRRYRYRRRSSRRRSRRRSSRSSGGSSSSGGRSVSVSVSTSGNGGSPWDNPAYEGYDMDSFTKAYDAASMFDDPSDKINNVIKQTGWSWLKASTFVNMVS